MKNSLKFLINRFEKAGKKISEDEDRSIEIIQSEEQKDNRIKTNEKRERETEREQGKGKKEYLKA